MGNVLFLYLSNNSYLCTNFSSYASLLSFQWVACDKCKAWQHQICALFNPKVVEEAAEYTCAKCLLKEKDSGDINLLESSTVLGALELPRTKLSDHIEQRLSARLEHERLQRARASGKGLKEVLVFLPFMIILYHTKRKSHELSAIVDHKANCRPPFFKSLFSKCYLLFLNHVWLNLHSSSCVLILYCCLVFQHDIAISYCWVSYSLQDYTWH
jgi:hypothetical protein